MRTSTASAVDIGTHTMRRVRHDSPQQDGGAAHRPYNRTVRLPPADRPSSAGPTELQCGESERFRQTHSKSVDLQGANDSLPLEMWNTVVSKNIPQPKLRSGSSVVGGASHEQPFTNMTSRSYTGTLSKMVSESRGGVPAQSRGGMPDIPRSQTLAPLKKQGLATVDEEASPAPSFHMDNLAQARPAATSVPSRADALLLLQAMEEMEASICENLGGHSPDELAMDAAKKANAERVMEILEPKIFSVDCILNELVKVDMHTSRLFL